MFPKAWRMLIYVACYRFSFLSPFPWNYKCVVPMALFIPNPTAGDNYTQETRRGTYFWGALRKKMVPPSLKGAKVCVCVGVGVFGGVVVTGPLPGLSPPEARGLSFGRACHQRSLWRLAKTRHGGEGGMKGTRKNGNELFPFSELTLCPFLTLLCPPAKLSPSTKCPLPRHCAHCLQGIERYPGRNSFGVFWNMYYMLLLGNQNWPLALLSETTTKESLFSQPDYGGEKKMVKQAFSVKGKTSLTGLGNNSRKDNGSVCCVRFPERSDGLVVVCIDWCRRRVDTNRHLTAFDFYSLVCKSTIWMLLICGRGGGISEELSQQNFLKRYLWNYFYTFESWFCCLLSCIPFLFLFLHLSFPSHSL